MKRTLEFRSEEFTKEQANVVEKDYIFLRREWEQHINDLEDLDAIHVDYAKKWKFYKEDLFYPTLENNVRFLYLDEYARLELDKLEYMTATDAAEELGVSRSRISALIKSGKLNIDENGIIAESVYRYKDKRKNGRPLNSFKLY